ncbi:hypothetical protein JQ636_35545 [Bradyrhizobium japonicum]|uniref:hypothetical protein n=1 Tax=Bradyrhizobium japonicum TaxID=375 RepID=UPI001BAA61F9|nr:hypothetical protein [Bradyrhizobium japonicum]MBR0733803.1 hypothetical protein [Bradyrhizobium japonicum]MBR0808874.1 hypothetical protein [Bradyrhizobium japonicum]
MKMIATAILALLSSAAYADVQIKMAPGSQCWIYQGTDTRYKGAFSAGQAITIAIVDTQIIDGQAKVIVTDGRDVWFNGPDLSLDGNRETNDPVIVIKKSGEHQIDLWEHKTGLGYGQPLFVKLCATKPKR